MSLKALWALTRWGAINNNIIIIINIIIYIIVRSLVKIFSLWNIWYKSVVLSLIWLHSLVT